MKSSKKPRATEPRLAARALSAAIISASALMAQPASAIVSSVNSSDWSGSSVDYLDGVGELIITRSDGSFGCSGSLLAGGAYVLTAAHCVSGSSATATTSSISLSFKSGSVTASMDSYYVNTGWTGDAAAGNDLALIKLTTAVTSISGYALDLGNAQGSTVVLAGYGLIGTGASGAVDGTFGSLYYGYNQYDASTRYYARNDFSSAVYLYDFDSLNGSGNEFGSTGLGAQEAMIASGDSGGATLVNIGGVWQIAGVHSFATCSGSSCPIDSGYGDIGGDTSVYANSGWLLSYLSVTAVPEPSSWAMLGAGLLAVARARRRQR